MQDAKPRLAEGVPVAFAGAAGRAAGVSLAGFAAGVADLPPAVELAPVSSDAVPVSMP